ncbi:MAG: hypothetical protein KF760_21185 [Candidatus Eremiobacteraeota bacterium]|nr:hypothetical protein [Candidatus Eremiobacteraeota bacterium]MCW5867289.1 hypothetical protein [Candidatus Eremiobacteraeota bacterium]
MNEEAFYHSSGQFTLERAVHDQRLGRDSLEDPALAPLWLVRAAVGLGASGASLRLSGRQVRIQLRCAPEARRPNWLERLPLSEERHQDVLTWTWPRPASRTLIRRESLFLRQRARFCPIPLKLNGYILQPEVFAYQAPGSELMPRGYHLAEFYFAGSGISVFRPDGDQAAGRVNSSHTYWREGEMSALRWWMPWRVAGQVARLKSCRGFRCGALGVLSAQPGQRSRALAVHQGVLAAEMELDWPELPGLCLVFDASAFPVDASGLKLVETLELRGALLDYRARLGQWVAARLESWRPENRGHGVISRQNRKEAGAFLSIWGVTVMTGIAVFLPLPLLGLPWIVWHHRSRRRIFQVWRRRLQELEAARAETPAGG